MEERVFSLSGLQFVALMIPMLGLFAPAWFVMEGIASIVAAAVTFAGYWLALGWLRRRFASRDAPPSM